MRSLWPRSFSASSSSTTASCREISTLKAASRCCCCALRFPSAFSANFANRRWTAAIAVLCSAASFRTRRSESCRASACSRTCSARVLCSLASIRWVSDLTDVCSAAYARCAASSSFSADSSFVREMHWTSVYRSTSGGGSSAASCSSPRARCCNASTTSARRSEKSEPSAPASRTRAPRRGVSARGRGEGSHTDSSFASRPAEKISCSSRVAVSTVTAPACGRSGVPRDRSLLLTGPSGSPSESVCSQPLDEPMRPIRARGSTVIAERASPLPI